METKKSMIFKEGRCLDSYKNLRHPKSKIAQVVPKVITNFNLLITINDLI